VIEEGTDRSHAKENWYQEKVGDDKSQPGVS